MQGLKIILLFLPLFFSNSIFPNQTKEETYRMSFTIVYVDSDESTFMSRIDELTIRCGGIDYSKKARRRHSFVLDIPQSIRSCKIKVIIDSVDIYSEGRVRLPNRSGNIQFNLLDFNKVTI